MTARPLRDVGSIPPGPDACRAALSVGELGDTIIGTLFDVGLHLQYVAPAADSTQAQHVHAAIDHLDRLIRLIRDAAFAAADPSVALAGAGRAEEGSGRRSYASRRQRRNTS